MVSEVQIKAIAIVSDVFLTSILIYVYYRIANEEKNQSNEIERQADFQKRQADLEEELLALQQNQQRLMEANHQPAIQILSWEAKRRDGEDLLEVELVNKGNGLAKNMSVKAKLAVYTVQGGREVYLPVGEYLESGSPEGVYPRENSLTPKDSTVVGETSAVLQPGEEDVFIANAAFERRHFDYKNGEIAVDEKIPFSEVLTEPSLGNKVSVSLELYYTDVLDDEQGADDFYSKVLEPDGSTTLRELLGHQTPVI